MTAYTLREVSVLGEEPVHVRVRDGYIEHVGRDQAELEGEVVDCAGLVMLPGLVDLHTHLRDPDVNQPDDVASGVAAGAHGGYTALCAMANTEPVGDRPGVVEDVARRARAIGMCDVFPVGAVSVGLGGREVTDIAALARSEAQVRMFSDDGKCVSRPEVLQEALTRVARVDGVLAQHAQDPDLTEGAQLNDGPLARELGMVGWPAVAEEAVIARDVVMAHRAGCRLHVCHVSTAGAVEVIRWAKSRGWAVTAEVTPHHLLLTDELVRGLDPVYKVNPPLRSDADVAALRVALVDGTIDAVATDHAPHPAEAKARPWEHAPMGMLGLETALAVVVQAVGVPDTLGWRQVADRMSTRPAEIAGRADVHGRPIAVGEPANWCLVDPECGWTVDPAAFESRSQNSPYAGRRLGARVVATALRGSVTFDGDGRFASSRHVPVGSP